MTMQFADVLAFIQAQWGCKDLYCSFDCSLEALQKLANQAFRDKVKNGVRTLPFCVRLVGQSGAGKTTQLLPAVCPALEACNIPYISLAVRDFVNYHPNLEMIRKVYGEALLREKTNAFALTLLTLVFEKLVQNRLPVLLEVTLLSPVYENFIHKCLKKFNYLCDYQCLVVAKKLSDQWISQRQVSTGRVVLEKSSQFFFDALKPAFKTLQSFQLNNRVLLWDCQNVLPLETSLNSENLWYDWQARACLLDTLDPKILLKNKKEFLMEFYKNTDFENLKI